MRRSRLTAPAIIVAVSIIITTACSSGGGLAVHQSSHPAASATPDPGSATGAIPTGTQLGKVLNGTHLPAGWKLPPGSGDLSNSGSTNLSQNGPPPHEYTCKYVGVAEAGYIISWWASSNATMILEYPGKTGSLPQVNLEVGAYAPGAAAKNMAKAAALIAHCRSFRVPGLPGHNTASVRTIPHLGTQNLFLTAKDHTGDVTITSQMLLVRDGNYIAGVDTNTGLDGNVRPATVQGFGGWLLQQLAHAKYLS